MNPSNSTYADLYRSQKWAYGDEPDRQLVEAVAGIEPGLAVDLGGGQGRHALYLASLGFEVELVDLSTDALDQARKAAADLGLDLRSVRSNLGFYEPPPGLQAVVASLVFHVPARHAALRTGERLGAALNPGGLLYLSLPGFDGASRAIAEEILAAAGCRGEVAKHVVTRQERPRLPVPRRNETRVVGFRS